MPTLNQMRNAIDTFLSNRWPTVVQRQNTFFTNNGRYWQGLLTHSAVPAHTNQTDGSKLADRLDSKPTDQNSSWANVLPEWATDLFPMSLRIDVYNGPQGHGWVATVEATHNGKTYRRSQNVGPETWRTQAWQEVVNGSI